MLNLQAQFVTRVHPWLLPLYVIGAFLTMLGTLYGTIEIACSIADEIMRTLLADWSKERARRIRLTAITWSASVAFVILGWLFIRQSTANELAPSNATVAAATPASGDTSGTSRTGPSPDVVPLQKPRLLLAVMTPVNLFSGVLSCGLICMLTFWMDRRWLPATLQPPALLVGLNLIAGVLFLALGIKGYWDNENRVLVVGSMLAMFVLAMLIAAVCGLKRQEDVGWTVSTNDT
jgi:hypothetical protein